MAQTSYPFDGLITTESEYSYLFRELQDTGVVGTGTELSVSADSTGMKVSVQPGMAIVRGHAYRSSAVEVVTIAASESAARTDTVILRLDPTENTITLVAIKGTTLTQTDTGIYEFPLATVAVGSNAVTIAASAVADARRRTGSRLGYWPSTALRPVSPRKRQLGYNEETGRWEQYTGTGWTDLVSWSTLPGKPTTSTIDGRNIFVSDVAPTAAQGANGDLWFEF